MKRPLRSSLRSTAGFTLLEIMMVVVIISLLLGTAIYKMSDAYGQARTVAARADLQSISTQLKLYNGMNGFYPTQTQGLKALVEKPASAPVPKQWSQSYEKIPHDPWDSEYNYAFPGKHNPKSFDLYSSGPDRQAGTDDDIGNWEK
jgi:general secretion pathway protein G